MKEPFIYGIVAIIISVSLSIAMYKAVTAKPSEYKCDNTEEQRDWYKQCLANRDYTLTGPAPRYSCKTDMRALFCERAN